MPVGDNIDMTRYAPQRRRLLALQYPARPVLEGPAREGAAAPAAGLPALDTNRQLALAVPESIRSLGEPLAPFIEACGGAATIALSVYRRDSEVVSKTYLFRQPFVVVGACRECDLPLETSDVAFRHLYLQLIGGRWFLVDLWRLTRSSSSSRRGCTGWFDEGDEVAVGPYLISRVASGPFVPAASFVPPASSGELTIVERAGAQTRVELEMVNGRSDTDGARRRRLVSAVTLIGASRQCDLWLRDDSVSKVHASLVLTPTGTWLIDLLGRDGVLVDGRPAYWKKLHDRSELTIGRFRFRVRLGDDSEHSLIRREPRELSPIQRRGSGLRRGGRRSPERVMLKLVERLAAMQSQFFEHSQLQMQFMTQMLASLERSQQASVRSDLARIDQITLELQKIQSQLAKPVAPSATLPATAQPDAGARIATPAQGSPASSESPSTVAAHTPAPRVPAEPRVDAGAGSTSAPAAESKQAPAATRTPPSPPKFTPVEETWTEANPGESNDRLARRMVKLASERNKRWKRVLQAFSRPPRSSDAETDPE